jgi:hypothetical protein
MTTTAVETRTSVSLTVEQANAATIAIAKVICASDIEDSDTWHGGIGTDLCEFCEALVIMRAAAGHSAKDCLRP